MKNKIFGIISFGALFVSGSLLIASKSDTPNPIEVKPSTVKPFEVPQQLSFCDEVLPLDRLDVQEKLDREILVNSYWQSNNLLMLKRSTKYFPIIEPILEKHGIPSDFKYLALIESGLQNVVSPAGAAGYWQIMKSTGRENGLIVDSEIDERYHIIKSTEVACAYLNEEIMKSTGRENGLIVDSEIDERYHIIKSTEVACAYLNEAYERFGNWTLAAASYNMGMAGTDRKLTEQRVSSYYDLLLNSETARYVYRIAAVKHIHENLEYFGYVFHEDYGYALPEFDTLQVSGPVNSWIDWALDHGTTYNTLREYNPWIRDDHWTSNAEGQTLTIWLPKK